MHDIHLQTRPPITVIAVLGPESSGKTELCQALAMHFHTEWVPEFAREYLPGLNRPYTADDLLFIAKQQRTREIQLAQRGKDVLFCDTELINIKQWSLHKFGFCHEWIETEIRKKLYSFYLLTAPDLPWIPDPLRENPGQGEYFFNRYKHEIEKEGYPFSVISGIGSERIRAATVAVTQWLNHWKQER